MRDSDCVEFLQWCLPQLNLRWAGFRKVRGTVCKRIKRRLLELGLEDLEGYRLRLAEDPKEWARLDSFCRIPISRFYRDRGLFERLRVELLPALAAAAKDRGAGEIRCWSAGCASGEEVYSLKIAWEQGGKARFPEIGLSILGTDVDETMLRRAKAGCYGRGSLKDLPQDLWDLCFVAQDNLLCLRPNFHDGIDLELQDIRNAWPEGIFDLILCRNLVFTYFAPPQQVKLLAELGRRLRAGGYLILGSHEKLPAGTVGYEALDDGGPIYRKLPLMP
jgi:chemotaxis protein methyltransferase CheR